jgi:hypothetical protein
MPDNSNRRWRWLRGLTAAGAGTGAYGGRRGRDADPHTLVGAYAMDAVSDVERAGFEQHLVSCEACRAEVRGLREAAARLAVAAEIRPRAELREQTVAAADLIRQLPPIEPADQAAPSGRRLARHSRTAPAASARGWLPRLAIGSAAVLAAAAVWLGVAMHGAEHQLTMVQGRSHRMAEVLGAPDATMMTHQVSTGGVATVVMSHRAGELLFTAADLRALPHARSYELWLMGPAGTRAAGVLPTPHDGMRGPMLVSGLAPGDEVGLTVERAGGAARPSASPILMLDLGS